MSALVEVEHLVFDYPTKRAINDTSFTIEEGSVTALVGPNGAGKTTLMKCIAALETPYSGTVVLDGINTQDEPRLCHSKLGFLPDFFGLYEDLTIRQHLEHFAGIHLVPKNLWSQRIEESVEKLGLTELVQKKASDLSRGQRQRLAVAMTIIHKPKLLLLDEPASGLDPEGRKELSDLITFLNQEGITIVVSSHILAELADYSTAMLTCKDGKVVASETLSTAEQADTTKLLIKVIDDQDSASQIIKEAGGQDLEVNDKGILLSFDSDSKKQADLLKHLLEKDIKVYSFHAAKENIQDVYFKHLEKKE